VTVAPESAEGRHACPTCDLEDEHAGGVNFADDLEGTGDRSRRGARVAGPSMEPAVVAAVEERPMVSGPHPDGCSHHGDTTSGEAPLATSQIRGTTHPAWAERAGRKRFTRRLIRCINEAG
jgi:hypothetical protein